MQNVLQYNGKFYVRNRAADAGEKQDLNDNYYLFDNGSHCPGSATAGERKQMVLAAGLPLQQFGREKKASGISVRKRAASAAFSVRG